MSVLAVQPVPQKHPNHDLYDFKNIADVPVSSFVKTMDCRSIADTLLSVPQSFRRGLLDEYETIYSESHRNEDVRDNEARRNANLYFLGVRKYADGRNFLKTTDESLKGKVERIVRQVALIVESGGFLAGLVFALRYGLFHVKYGKVGFELPQAWDIFEDQVKYYFKRSETNTDEMQLKMMKKMKDKERSACEDGGLKIIKGINARLVCADWWMLQLIKKQDRGYEGGAIFMALVRATKQAYVSDFSLDKVISRHRRSMEVMSGFEAVSDEGDEINMLDVLKGSMANPAVRRAELMNRLHGFEQYGDEKGHIAEFYTLTVPSKYHANSNKYNGWTPRDVQKGYLVPLWARIRAALNKAGLYVYGFRVAEPHADGCPHWHILLFMTPENAPKIRKVLKGYALKEDGEEIGAAENRFECEVITKEKGSAISYIAKYISKNVDGFGMDDEIDHDTGSSINESAKRVKAWSSIWGIRQFQQIGGASVTAWRELRRLKDVQENEDIERVRKEADAGDWKGYLCAQDIASENSGGYPIGVYYSPSVSDDTGEIKENRYGEIVEPVKGVATFKRDKENSKRIPNEKVVTRIKEWKIQRKKEQDVEKEIIVLSSNETVEQSMQRLLEPVHCSSAVLGHVEELDAATALAFDLPWSSVNNCSKPKNQPIRESDFLAKELEIEYKKRLKAGELFDVDCETFVKNLLKKV